MLPSTCHPDRPRDSRSTEQCHSCRTRDDYRRAHPDYRGRSITGTRKPIDPAYKRGRALAAKYGITLDEYTAMYEVHGGKCAMCERGFAVLDVDHDHKTGRVRGLLCRGCNTLLGHVEKRAGLIERAKEYLVRQSAID